MKSFLCVALLLASCAQQQQAYRFALAQPPPVDNIATALTSAGQSVAATNPGAGIVQTEWRDTGFNYGFVQGAAATIVRRYVVTVLRQPAQTVVQVHADVQKCAQATVKPTEVIGTCEAMEGLVPKHQDELNVLGVQLKQTLGGTVITN
jgi:hypothetical protein